MTRLNVQKPMKGDVFSLYYMHYVYVYICVYIYIYTY